MPHYRPHAGLAIRSFARLHHPRLPVEVIIKVGDKSEDLLHGSVDHYAVLNFDHVESFLYIPTGYDLTNLKR
jgi:hypothetical protein